MKGSKGEKATPMKEVVDLRSRSADPRVDPQATTRISREELDAVLRRASGTRPATNAEVRRQSGAIEVPSTRPAPRDPRAERDDSFSDDAVFGPREDRDPASWSAPSSAAATVEGTEISHARFVMPPQAPPPETPRESGTAIMSKPRARLRLPRRTLQLVALFAAVITIASLVGFLAGRLGR